MATATMNSACSAQTFFRGTEDVRALKASVNVAKKPLAKAVVVKAVAADTAVKTAIVRIGTRGRSVP